MTIFVAYNHLPTVRMMDTMAQGSKYIRYIAMTILVMLVSLVQFHHHDDDGCMTLMLLPDIGITVGNHADDNDTHHHHGHSRSANEYCAVAPQKFIATANHALAMPPAILTEIPDDMLTRNSSLILSELLSVSNPQLFDYKCDIRRLPIRRGPPQRLFQL